MLHIGTSWKVPRYTGEIIGTDFWYVPYIQSRKPRGGKRQLGTAYGDKSRWVIHRSLTYEAGKSPFFPLTSPVHLSLRRKQAGAMPYNVSRDA